jgi:hypothetical protein
LSVRVEIDEAGGHDEPGRVDRVATADRIGRDDGDAAVLDSDIAHGIEARCRIHHAPAEDDAIVGGRGQLEGDQQAEKHARGYI